MISHTVASVLQKTKQILFKDHEAEAIVRHCLQDYKHPSDTRLEFYSCMKLEIPNSVADNIVSMAHKRASGIPLQYLTGVQTFLNHEYSVGTGVLIPRPETEVLVTQAIKILSQNSKFQSGENGIGIEIGIGSGILSIELLSRFSSLKMLASDVSEAALTLAKQNALKILGPECSERLELLRADGATDPFRIFEGRSADFIISNPPYLTSDDSIEEEVLTHEPATALFAPNGDPLYFYREIAQKGQAYLKEGGFVFLELPHERSEDIFDLFNRGPWRAEIFPDLTGRPRVLVALMIV